MRTIELDATGWATLSDFYRALLSAIGAPKDHGRNINALVDSMIWTDQINSIKPPYNIRISGTAHLTDVINSEIVNTQSAIKTARQDHLKLRGRDVHVVLESDSNGAQ